MKLPDERAPGLAGTDERPTGPNENLLRAPVALWLRIDPWIAAALACALALRLFRLDAAPVWLDEIDTALMAALSSEQMMQTAFQRTAFGPYDAQHLPLYFMIINLWTKIVGLSPWLMRLPGVVFSVGTVWIASAIGRTLSGIRTARWAAWLAAVSPFLIHHAQEARMYTLVGMLSAASILLLVRYLCGASHRLGGAFVLVNCAFLATHYYTAFLISGELLLLCYLRPRPYRNWWPAWIANALAALLLACVALVFTHHQSGEVYGLGWLAAPGVFWAMIMGYTLLPSSEELHVLGRAAIWPYLPYVVAGAFPVMLLVVAGLRSLQPPARHIVLLLMISICVGPFAAAAAFQKISLNPRYFTAGVPLLLIVMAAGMPRPGAAWWRIGAATAAIVLIGLATALELAFPGQKREDIIAAGAWLDRNVPVDAEISVTSVELASMAEYHWPKRRIRLYPPRKTVANAANAATLAQGLVAGRKRVYYLLGRTWLSDPEGNLERAIRARYPSCGATEVRGIRIYCLLPDE